MSAGRGMGMARTDRISWHFIEIYTRVEFIYLMFLFPIRDWGEEVSLSSSHSVDRVCHLRKKRSGTGEQQHESAKEKYRQGCQGFSFSLLPFAFGNI